MSRECYKGYFTLEEYNKGDIEYNMENQGDYIPYDNLEERAKDPVQMHVKEGVNKVLCGCGSRVLLKLMTGRIECQNCGLMYKEMGV